MAKFIDYTLCFNTLVIDTLKSMAKEIKRKTPSIKKTFGLTVRMLRYQAEMSQEELAEKSHMHPTYISSVERGQRSVGLEKIVQIAAALGVSPKDLMPP